MIVSLIQRPTEVKMCRKTILMDGSQVGYFHGPDRPLIFTRHVSQDVAELVKAEVQRAESCQCGKLAIPAETPPEWLEEDDEEEATTEVLP